MSDNVVQALSTFGPLIGDVVPNYALISTGKRQIGTMIPNVVLEEIHRDELQITQHPVESGSPVSDHAFMQPVSVEMRCGWSNSTARSEGYVQAVYSALQALQQARQPFSVTTGKRSYNDMLIRSLIVRTDPDSEYALMVIALLQQVTIVGSASTGGGEANSDGSNDVYDSATGASWTPSGGADSVSTFQIGPDTLGGTSQSIYGFPTSYTAFGYQSISGPIEAAGG